MESSRTDECARALAKLSRRQLATLRELHASRSTSELHEQLKQLLGMRKMGDRARAIGLLLQLNCSADSDEDTELVLEHNELDAENVQSDGDELIIEDNAVLVQQQSICGPKQAASGPAPQLVFLFRQPGQVQNLENCVAKDPSRSTILKTLSQKAPRRSTYLKVLPRGSQ